MTLSTKTAEEIYEEYIDELWNRKGWNPSFVLAQKIIKIREQIIEIINNRNEDGDVDVNEIEELLKTDEEAGKK